MPGARALFARLGSTRMHLRRTLQQSAETHSPPNSSRVLKTITKKCSKAVPRELKRRLKKQHQYSFGRLLGPLGLSWALGAVVYVSRGVVRPSWELTAAPRGPPGVCCAIFGHLGVTAFGGAIGVEVGSTSWALETSSYRVRVHSVAATRIGFWCLTTHSTYPVGVADAIL